jgi:hypothetical protein
MSSPEGMKEVSQLIKLHSGVRVIADNGVLRIRHPVNDTAPTFTRTMTPMLLSQPPPATSYLPLSTPYNPVSLAGGRTRVEVRRSPSELLMALNLGLDPPPVDLSALSILDAGETEMQPDHPVRTIRNFFIAVGHAVDGGEN